MAGINDILLFAQGVSPNVIDQPAYAAAPWVDTGFQAGLAESDQLNKVWRQASLMAYVVAAFIIDQLPTVDVLDDDDADAIVALLAQAVGKAASVQNGRVVTSSAALTITKADSLIGLNRTAAVAAMNANLPADAEQFQEFTLVDMQGNLFASPVTFVPAAGTINGLVSWKATVDRGRVEITYWGGNVWTANIF